MPNHNSLQSISILATAKTLVPKLVFFAQCRTVLRSKLHWEYTYTWFGPIINQNWRTINLIEFWFTFITNQLVFDHTVPFSWLFFYVLYSCEDVGKRRNLLLSLFHGEWLQLGPGAQGLLAGRTRRLLTFLLEAFRFLQDFHDDYFCPYVRTNLRPVGLFRFASNSGMGSCKCFLSCTLALIRMLLYLAYLQRTLPLWNCDILALLSGW